ncbi:MAG: M1 family metallopeptidase, partial [Anaerolineales bacterium]
ACERAEPAFLPASTQAATLPASTSPTAAMLTLTPPLGATQTLDPSTGKNTPLDMEAVPSRTQYRLVAVLDYDQHYLLVDEQIQYTNRVQQPIPDLRLMVDPLYYPGVFNLKNLAWGNGEQVSDYSIETGQISIPLTEPLMPGQSINLSINYELRLPSPVPSAESRPVPFGYTSRQTNLVDWYPFIPPFKDGTGWQAHQAGFFGEHLVYEQSDFDVSIQMIGSSPDVDAGQDADLKVAASAPASIEGDWYNYQHVDARNFAWSVSRDYQVYSTTVGATTILSYAFPFHEAAGKAVLQTTAESLELFNSLYDTYPRPLISVVEADFLDGMEYDGMYFLSNGFYNLYQGQPGEYLVAIAAHETAHQWFYAMVGNDQAIEPWLDEALCTYHERIYYEKLYPDAVDWWWDYRINYYDPQGWVDGSIYNPQGYRAYRNAIYLNGAVFLDELRNQIGDQTFFAFLADYVNTTKDSLATGDRFFEILSRHTDQDLTPLVSRFFQSR